MQIIASDAPGTASQVIIRGLGTVLAGREPLYVVDGVLTNNINNINTADIDKISVLKDAASLAIYGNRGANGVIIVTTKKGKNGKISFSFDSNVGIRNINFRPRMANTNSFITYDLLAMKWIRYGYIYPFIEAYAGIGMVAQLPALAVAPFSLFIGTVGAISVFKAVYIDKRELKCACVGGDSSVPLGFVSLSENLFMIAGALIMLFL